METTEQFKNLIKKSESHSVDQVAQVCSGSVRLEQCECEPAGERGGGHSCCSTTQDNRAKCECVLRTDNTSCMFTFGVSN